MLYPMISDLSRHSLILQKLYWRLRLFNNTGPESLNTITLLDGKTTLKQLIETGQSFSRFGEGELRLAFQQSGTIYDDRSFDLGRDLRQILLYKNENVLVGYNNLFLKNNEIRWIRAYLRSQKAANFFESIHSKDDVLVLDRRKLVTEYRKYLRLLACVSDQEVFGEASAFSLGTYVDDFRNGTIEEVKSLIIKLLESNSLLVIAPEKPATGRPLLKVLSGKDWRISGIQSILVPERNAYMIRDELMAKISQTHEKFDTVVIQAGATGSLFSSQIQSKFGIRAIDVGGFGVGEV
jgi:hypothetical protein